MLQEGNTFAALTAALTRRGFDGDVADGSVLDLLCQWSAQNIVRAIPSASDAPRCREQHLHIAGVDAAIRYAISTNAGGYRRYSRIWPARPAGPQSV
jgi:hypothetical protein